MKEGEMLLDFVHDRIFDSQGDVWSILPSWERDSAEIAIPLLLDIMREVQKMRKDAKLPHKRVRILIKPDVPPEAVAAVVVACDAIFLDNPIVDVIGREYILDCRPVFSIGRGFDNSTRAPAGNYQMVGWSYMPPPKCVIQR